MEKRKLTEEEIEYVVDFIKPNKHIHPETAMSIVNINKQRIRKQFINVEIYPPLIDTLKMMIKKQYEESLINPGQSVGIICAQSIGEKNTQNTLNTFHKAGQSEKSVLAGVPRFQEILNTTKDPKAPSCKIFFKENNDTIKNLRDIINSTIVEINFSDLIETYVIEKTEKEKNWYEIFNIVYQDEEWFKNYKDGEYDFRVSFKLKTDILYKYKINYENIIKVLHKNFDDEICCLFSNDELSIIDIFVNTTDIELPEKTIEFITEENINYVFIEESAIPELYSTMICGIKNIESIYYTHKMNDGKDEWYVDTDGSNYLEIMNLPNVDNTRTLSNNMWEIYNVLGIEATREFLINECLEIMESVNMCHVKLLVERMTFTGNIASISRYTMRQDESGPMGKASFEESTDNFLRAAYECDTENTNGVSASIICGKKGKNGTGIMKLKLDTDNFF